MNEHVYDRLRELRHETNGTVDFGGADTVDEVLDREPHPPEVLQHMRDHLEEAKQLGIEAIND